MRILTTAFLFALSFSLQASTTGAAVGMVVELLVAFTLKHERVARAREAYMVEQVIHGLANACYEDA